MMVDESPHRHCFLLYIVLVSFPLIIAQKCPEFTSIDLICYETKHSSVEFEHGWHLYMYHSNQIQELSENWCPLLIRKILIVMAIASGKLVTK
jgi:hypothetical protein